MPSNDLKGDAMAVFSDHRDTIVAAGGIGIVIVFLLVLFGGMGAVGGVLFLGYALIWVTVLAIVLWLFYRLVTAIERIAAAQERLASNRRHETVSTTAASESAEDAAAGDDERTDESADTDSHA